VNGYQLPLLGLSKKAILERLTKPHQQALVLVPVATNRLYTRNDTHVLTAVVEVIGAKAWHVERVLWAFDILAPFVLGNKATGMH
jgi:hypothetical protein